MLDVLRNPSFRRLFAAQIVALVGTGLATVALALLAYDLAETNAGAVLGTALAIKMAVYVLLAPLAGAIVPPNLRKPILVGLDLVRAGVALALPFVTEVWQVYLLIALLQSASACFTPLFQSVVPEILTDERDYTRALSLSRLAYDLESLLSPLLAAALLTLISFHGLFAGTSLGFVLSAALVLSAVFPSSPVRASNGSPYARALRGIQIYVRTPRLRGLLALNLCAAAGGSMVFVNTVVVVRDLLGGGEREVAWALGAFGLGSVVVALGLPRLLERFSDRHITLCAALCMSATLTLATLAWIIVGHRLGWAWVIPLWVALGMAYAGLVTPGGRLIRRSARPDDLPFLFAAQFSLSHLCWLIAYPAAGWLGSAFGLSVAFTTLAAMAALGTLMAWRLWPSYDPLVLPHRHDDLPADHSHWEQGPVTDGAHAHPFVIDPLHRRWPR